MIIVFFSNIIYILYSLIPVNFNNWKLKVKMNVMDKQ